MSPTPSTTVDPAFALRLRELLSQKGVSLAQLAAQTELEPSLLSRLAAENDASRRGPQIEHIFAIARALEISAADLVTDTAAAVELHDWVPRSAYEEQEKVRVAAQQQAASLRADLASANARAAELRREGEEARRKLAKVEGELREQRGKYIELAAQATVTRNERDDAMRIAKQNYDACVAARMKVASLEQQLAGAKGSATTGWALAGLGALTTILGAASSSGSGRKRRS